MSEPIMLNLRKIGSLSKFRYRLIYVYFSFDGDISGKVNMTFHSNLSSRELRDKVKKRIRFTHKDKDIQFLR